MPRSRLPRKEALEILYKRALEMVGYILHIYAAQGMVTPVSTAAEAKPEKPAKEAAKEAERKAAEEAAAKRREAEEAERKAAE